MKASNPGNVKTAVVYIIDLQVTCNDLKLKISKLQLYVYQMKASNPGNL